MRAEGTPSRPGLALATATFGILALELAVIRWMGGQIRVVAYFQNLVLLAAFFGMGLGVALGRRHPHLIHWCLPAMAALAAPVAFSDALGLMFLKFPDPTISLWGGDQELNLAAFAAATLLVTGFFWAVAAVFLLAGIPVGYLFHELPPVRAYSVDILGSLLGVIAMTAAAALGTGPVVWFALGVTPLVLLSRKPQAVAGAAAVLVLAYVSIDGATFSPYNRIDVVSYPDGRADERRLQVNRDFHQDIVNLSEEAVAGAPDERVRRQVRGAYELPFRVRNATGQGRSAVVVGAGTGNDVAAAVRMGYTEVYSVEIDREILRYGAQLHPERPYDHPGVVPVVDDARAFFEQHRSDRFDVVCYGLLDSHSMFSAMSSLRLDNYVYTVEGIRAGWEHVADGGVLSVSFSVYAGQWMAERMLGIIREATGQDPIMVAHGVHYGLAFLVGKNLQPEHVPTNLGMVFRGGPPNPAIDIPHDDWPFLYLRPGAVPYAYLAVLAMLLATAALAIRLVYGRGVFSAERFHLAMFLLGAAFMLLETRMVTALSLLFGSTWVVNSSVFAGILTVILAGNLIVERRAPTDVAPWFAPLALALLVTYLVPPSALGSLGLVARGAIGGVMFAVPVGFAAVIFATLLKRAPDPSGSLGSNLIGAMAGGVLEYSSMALGLRAMVLLALGLYLAALLVHLRTRTE